MHMLPACPSSQCWGANDFLAGWVFSAPLSVIAILHEAHGAKSAPGAWGPSLCPMGHPGCPAVGRKKTAFAKLEVLPRPPGSC